MSSKKNSRCPNSVTESLDTLSEGHNLALSSEKQGMHSSIGAVCSVLIFTIVALFAYQKSDILLKNCDMNLLAFYIQDYLDDNNEFLTADGLSIAFASTMELDPTYASL